MPSDFLRQTETELADLAGLPGAIRDRVKAGVAELGRLRDAIDAEIARLTGGARATLASLQALGTIEPEAGETAAANSDPTPPAGDVASPPTL